MSAQAELPIQTKTTDAAKEKPLNRAGEVDDVSY